MKTKGVIGKRIVAIRQQTFREKGYPVTSGVLEIELENGWLLRPIVSEGVADYSVDLVVAKPRRTKP